MRKKVKGLFRSWMNQLGWISFGRKDKHFHYDIQKDENNADNYVLIAEPTQLMRNEQREKYKDHAMQKLETVIIAKTEEFPLFNILVKKLDYT